MTNHFQAEIHSQSFDSSVMHTEEVKQVLERSILLDQEKTPTAQAEAKILSHIIDSIKDIKDINDVNGMAKALVLIEQGESLLTSRKPNANFFHSSDSQTIQSSSELNALKEYFREHIGQSIESRLA